MKRLSRKTKELISFCDEEVNDRRGTYANRTQEWRESDRGERYSEIIDEMVAVQENLNYLISLLEEEAL